MSSFSVGIKNYIFPVQRNILFESFSVAEKLTKIPLTPKNTLFSSFSMCIPGADIIQPNKMRRGTIVRRR